MRLEVELDDRSVITIDISDMDQDEAVTMARSILGRGVPVIEDSKHARLIPAHRIREMRVVED